jgi:hypothetical protein
MLPNFLIAGAAKCGTTSLSAWLGSHPDVFLPAEKELHFFEREEVWKNGIEWYEARFAQAAAVGEATPAYMFHPHAVERIARTLPRVRAVVCLRDPVDRAHSHYLHWRELGLDRRSFAEAIDDELAAGATEVALHRPDSDPPYFAYLARGRYAAQLERLGAVLGRDRVHVLLLEDMAEAPDEVFAGVCRFLGVDDGFVPPNLGRRENVYGRRLGRRLLPRRRPDIEPALRARLGELFRADNEKLATWLGRDLSHWGV